MGVTHSLIGFARQVDQCPVRTVFGKNRVKVGRKRTENASDEGERVAIVVPPRSE